MKKALLFLPIVFMMACGSSSDDAEKDQPIVIQKSPFGLTTIMNPDSTWGYIIMKDNKPFIKQEFIPSVAGRQGFDKEAKAQKCGEFVIKKLNNGEMPPSVSPEELQSLGLL